MYANPKDKIQEVNFPAFSGNSTVTVQMFETDNKFKIQILEPGSERTTEIEFRNVGEKNKNSSLQFVVEQITKKRKNYRTELICFSIPFDMAKTFIDAIQKIQ